MSYFHAEDEMIRIARDTQNRIENDFVYYCSCCDWWWLASEGIPDECGGAECPDCGGDLQTEEK